MPSSASEIFYLATVLTLSGCNGADAMLNSDAGADRNGSDAPMMVDVVSPVDATSFADAGALLGPPPSPPFYGVVTRDEPCRFSLVAECSSDASATTLEFEGNTPFGTPITLTAAVTYHYGFGQFAELIFYGTAGEMPFAIRTTPNNSAPVAPPGAYDDTQGTIEWQTPNMQCSSIRAAVHTVIEEHDAMQGDSSIRLRGNFSVDQDDWQIDGEFVLLESCGWINEL